MAPRGVQIQLQPRVLRWARERAGFEVDELALKIPVRPKSVMDWEYSGEITLPQAQRLARYTYIDFDCLLLSEPLPGISRSMPSSRRGALWTSNA